MPDNGARAIATCWRHPGFRPRFAYLLKIESSVRKNRRGTRTVSWRLEIREFERQVCHLTLRIDAKIVLTFWPRALVVFRRTRARRSKNHESPIHCDGVVCNRLGIWCVSSGSQLEWSMAMCSIVSRAARRYRLHHAVSLGPKCPGGSAIESLDRLSGSYLVPNRQPGCNLFARRPHDSI